MELQLRNIGIIRDASVKCDGLTVITGKNNSGKTTVGKTIYALTRANSDIDAAFERSKAAYTASRLNDIWITLTGRQIIYSAYNVDIRNLTKKERILHTLSRHIPETANGAWLANLLDDVKETLRSLRPDEFEAYLRKDFLRSVYNEGLIRRLREQFDERREEALESCDRALETLNDPQAFYGFLLDRTRRFLNLAFHDQVKPVRNQRLTAQAKIMDGGRMALGLKVRSKSNFEFLGGTSMVFPYGRAVFIDDPFVIDRMEPDGEKYSRRAAYREAGDTINAVDITPPDVDLLTLLNAKVSGNFFADREFQKKHRAIFEKINKIIPGEFQRSDDGVFYVDDGAPLNVQNLATGSKLFSLLKLLLMNGYLAEGTILILDEPESHLHPEWINRFAEIMVLFIKEMGVHILLTTHSPNLLLALDFYAKQSGISEASHFYLAKRAEDGWHAQVDCIDENISEGYAHLSIPLLEMTIRQDAAKEG